MSDLIPLKTVPNKLARENEKRSREEWPDIDMALAASTIRIVEAAGCYSGGEPKTIGWVLTRAAAEAIREGSKCAMPGGTSHYRFAFESGCLWARSSAMDDYIADIRGGVDKIAALAHYRAAVE